MRSNSELSVRFNSGLGWRWVNDKNMAVLAGIIPGVFTKSRSHKNGSPPWGEELRPRPYHSFMDKRLHIAQLFNIRGGCCAALRDGTALVSLAERARQVEAVPCESTALLKVSHQYTRVVRCVMRPAVGCAGSRTSTTGNACREALIGPWLARVGGHKAP